MVVGGSREWHDATLPERPEASFEESLRSCAYVEAVAAYISQRMRVVAIQNSDPDTDFVFLARSSHFASSGAGQFSALLNRLVEKNGGKSYRASTYHGDTIGWRRLPECYNLSESIAQLECSV